MGLTERRKIKELQDDVFPARVLEIQEICGAPIPYEVDWESLASDLAGLNYIDNISCHRLNMALRVICQDDMGRGAVRDGLKLIKLKNVGDEASRKLAFAGGILEMHCMYSLGASGMFSDSEIRKVLESGL